MDKRNWFILVLLLVWLGLIILSIVTGHFNVPEGLKTSWNNFVTVTHESKIAEVVAFIFFALIITVISFAIGWILLPIEIVVFPIMALVTLNGFWLTTFIIWKYELLFAIIF